MSEDFDLPEYYVVGTVPVKMVETSDGGMDVLAFNAKIGKFERDMRYLSECFRPGATDVEKLSEEEFNEYVERFREELLLKQ